MGEGWDGVCWKGAIRFWLFVHAPAYAGGALPKPKLDTRLQPRQRSATEQWLWRVLFADHFWKVWPAFVQLMQEVKWALHLRRGNEAWCRDYDHVLAELKASTARIKYYWIERQAIFRSCECITCTAGFALTVEMHRASGNTAAQLC